MIRIRISLDGIWDFYPDPTQSLTPEKLKEQPAPRRIQVPGPWQAQFEDLRNYSGVAWYRHTFEFPKGFFKQAIPDPTYILHFGAVDYFTTVWLNGVQIGEHEGGYLPFDIQIDNALRPEGPNELIVRVVDPGDDAEISRKFGFAFSEIPHGKQSWYGPIGGIWQSVYMEARHSTHVKSFHITPQVEKEQADVELRLNRAAPRRMNLQLVLIDPKGELTKHFYIVEKGQEVLTESLSTPNPLLWDTTTPHLYRLEATLSRDMGDTDMEYLDSIGSYFGMRSISASPDGHLMLNGRVLYLRGALDQDYYPELIYTPFSDAELDEQFEKAKHMGLNMLRTHIKITDSRYYDAADRAGILIWTELPNWQNLTSTVKYRALETIKGMVERDWNHPSIVVWTIVNEGWGVDLAVNADHRNWLSQTYDFLKRLDPYRLVVGNSACFTNFHVVTDIEDFHNYYSIPDHYRQWRDWVETFAARPPWTFAHSYETIDKWREFLGDPWKPTARTPAGEVRRTGREPIVVSEFGNWGLPDVAKLRECYHGKEPWWFETGMEWGEGSVYPHGVEDRFRMWHVDKVFPTYSDLAAASQRMQFCALKYEIEQMRRFPSIVGYIITEFTDVHWECNGLLDMCRNPKAFYDAMANINSADAIVPGWERVAFWEGERVEVQLTVSHFSSTEMQPGCKLEWRLDQWPEINGEFTGFTLRHAQITPVGTVVFEVPALEKNARARLEFRLIDFEGNVVTSNHHEIYFFQRLRDVPRCKVSAPPELRAQLESMGFEITEDLSQADLAVVGTMTDELRWYTQNGGRVLWLAESENSQQAYLGAVNILPRQGRTWQGDWASNFNWIRQDLLFKDIPTDGCVDFAFADLTPEHVIQGLSPRDFAADVHSGLFVGWIHHTVALIAERRLSHGRLLISTFRLKDHIGSHPVATIMVRDMIQHLAVATGDRRPLTVEPRALSHAE